MNPTHGTGSHFGLLRTAKIAQVLGRRAQDTDTARRDIFDFEPVQPDDASGWIIHHDEHRQDPLFVRIQFAERRLGEVGRVVRDGGDRHSLARLVEWVRGSRIDLNRGLVLVGGESDRYTSQKNQAFESQRYLFPLSFVAGACLASSSILFRRSCDPEESVPEISLTAMGNSAPPT